jgi:hypothetical protein
LLLGRPGATPGSVEVYQRDLGGTDAWGFLRDLTPSDSAPGDWFGASVALDGDSAVVGAPRRSTTEPGSAYVFERDLGGADQWGERKRLIGAGSQGADEAGYSVALEGNVVLVGVPKRDLSLADSGSVLVFVRDQGGSDHWGETKEISPRIPVPGPSFGKNVTLRDGLALVGTYVAAFVFGPGSPAQAESRNDAGGINPVSLAASPPTLGETFEVSVDLTTTGHSFAWLLGFASPAAIALPQGPVLLGTGRITPRIGSHGPLARFSFLVPNDPALCGRGLVLQAVHVGGPPFALSNACDLVVGTGY